MLVFSSKKGVSPLIATILLIAFAVALGAVVMQLGAGLAGADCSTDAQLAPKGFPCFDGKKVKLSLKNSGSSDLGGVSVWIYGEKEGIKTKNIDNEIAAGSGFNVEVDYDKSIYGAIKSIDVIPKLKNGEGSCEAAKIEITDISDC